MGVFVEFEDFLAKDRRFEKFVVNHEVGEFDLPEIDVTHLGCSDIELFVSFVKMCALTDSKHL
jgi:hypothetical protein